MSRFRSALRCSSAIVTHCLAGRRISQENRATRRLQSIADVRSVSTLVHGRQLHAYVEDSARGTPVVLVHGLGISARYLLPTARVLAEDHPVYAPDLPGFGLTPGPKEALDIPGLARELLAWMDAMKIEQPILLANSMGCQTVTALAAMAPNRISRLVLVGPCIDPKYNSIMKQIPRWLLDTFREPFALFPVILRDYLRCGFRRFMATGRHALKHPIEGDAPNVKVPVLVVRGEHDAFSTAAWAEKLAKLFPQGKSATIYDAAHAVNFSAPHALAGLVRWFCGRASLLTPWDGRTMTQPGDSSGKRQHRLHRFG